MDNAGQYLQSCPDNRTFILTGLLSSRWSMDLSRSISKSGQYVYVGHPVECWKVCLSIDLALDKPIIFYKVHIKPQLY
jgi:hypothetical protein